MNSATGGAGAAPTEVAVGVLIRDDGAFLIAQRPPGKPMAGYWEFPGGKIEPGETVFEGLRREFHEELGIEIVSGCPWAQRVFVYPHATVRLHFWRVYDWHGEPQSLEGQAFCWEHIAAVRSEPWLPGALPLRRWLQLPDCYAISAAALIGPTAFLAALDARLADGSVRLLQWREPDLPADQCVRLFAEVRARAREHGARLLVSSRHVHLLEQADGLHLTAADLQGARERPGADWVAASCHDAADIARASELGLDFAVLGPVLPTASHPGAATLGWAGFAATAGATGIPVYALGGMQPGLLAAARQHGAQGVALLRGAWAEP